MRRLPKSTKFDTNFNLQKRSKVIKLEYEAASTENATSSNSPKAFRSYAEEMRYLGKGKLLRCKLNYFHASYLCRLFLLY